MGVSGAGKTTIGKMVAAAAHFSFIDGDELHPEANIRKMQASKPLDDQDRQEWFRRIIERINIMQQETGVVLACSALKKSYRDLLRMGIASLRFVYLQGDYETIQRQLAARKSHFMPADLLRSQFQTLEPPTAAEPDVHCVVIQSDAQTTGAAVIRALNL
ncbi:gluconokinase [Niabella terrae]